MSTSKSLNEVISRLHIRGSPEVELDEYKCDFGDILISVLLLVNATLCVQRSSCCAPGYPSVPGEKGGAAASGANLLGVGPDPLEGRLPPVNRAGAPPPPVIATSDDVLDLPGAGP